jgi:hypothetical protein
VRLTPDDRFEIVHGYTFNDNIAPDGSLVLGDDGALYGNEVIYSAASPYSTLYRLTLNGTFTPYPFGIAGPIAASADGSVYLARGTGGPDGGISRLTPDGDIVLVHAFNNVDGKSPVSVLTRG